MNEPISDIKGFLKTVLKKMVILCMKNGVFLHTLTCRLNTETLKSDIHHAVALEVGKGQSMFLFFLHVPAAQTGI